MKKKVEGMTPWLCIFLAILMLFSPSMAWADSPPVLKAKGAIVMDYESGEVLYGKNIYTPRSSASMTKLMTALLVYDAIGEGRIEYNTRVPIPASIREKSKLAFQESERVYDLLSLLLVASVNDTGYILAEYLGGTRDNFVKMMNQKARDLAINTRYNDPIGLKINPVSPLAQAQLTRHFIKTHPELLEITKKKAVNFHGKTYRATNRFYHDFAWYNGARVEGIKTGTTRSAGSCITTTATRGERRLITAVFGSPSGRDRYLDSIELLEFGLAQYPISYQTSKWAKEIPLKVDQRGFNTARVQGKMDFQGREPIHRGEFASLLVRALQVPQESGEEFSDVPRDAWYYTDLHTARARGLVQGVGDNLYQGDRLLSRQEMALMIQNALGLERREKYLAFADDERIGQAYREAVYTLREYGLVNGRPRGEFDPQEMIRREEACQILLNILDKIGIENIG